MLDAYYSPKRAVLGVFTALMVTLLSLACSTQEETRTVEVPGDRGIAVVTPTVVAQGTSATPTVSQTPTSSPDPTRTFKDNNFVTDDVSIEISKCFLVKHDKEDPFGFLSNIFDDQTNTVFNANEDILFVIIGLISSISKDVEIKWSLAWLPRDGRDGEIIEYSQIVRRGDYFPSLATPGYAIQSADGTVKTILPLAIPPKDKFVEKGNYQILTSTFEVDGRVFELANCGTNYTMQ